MKASQICAAVLVLTAAAVHAQPAPSNAQCGSVVGNPALSIEVCTKAIESGRYVGTDLARAYYTRGTEWATRGDHDRAIADFNVTLELDPKLGSAYFNRAVSWAINGEPDRAIADYDAALRFSPRDAGAYIGRGAEWIAKGEFRRAITDYDEAIRIDAKATAAYFGRARAKYYAGEFAPASSDFIRAHQLDANVYTAIWLYLARKRADIAGEKTLAQEAGARDVDAWPAPIVALYLGTATPEAVQKAAVSQNPTRQRDQRCEANFYVGQWHVLRGASGAAEPLLRDAVIGCPPAFIEYEGAVAELKRLEQKR